MVGAQADDGHRLVVGEQAGGGHRPMVGEQPGGGLCLDSSVEKVLERKKDGRITEV